MTASLTIGRARTQARVIGARAEAPWFKSRLEALLSGPVAGRLAEQPGRLPDGADAAAVIRVPKLAVRLVLNRADLESAVAADRWAEGIGTALAALLSSTDAAAQGPDIWHFPDRRAYHAAYVRHRLGLVATPDGVFDGFAALDQLSPCRAMSEMLAADPLLWHGLVAERASALQIVQAVLRLGGAEGAALVLGPFPQEPDAVADTLDADLLQALADLPGAVAVLGGTQLPGWREMPAAAQSLYLALHLGRQGMVRPQVPAVLIVTLLGLVAVAGAAPAARVGQALERLQAGTAGPVPMAGRLAQLAGNSAEAANRIAACLPALVQLSPGATFPGSFASPIGVVADHPIPPTPAGAAPADDLRRFEAPFAGVGLLLPFLAEDRIGAAFPAHQRLAALAGLVRSARFEAPETSEFLLALAGADRRADVPDRPGPRDLLFVPHALHDGIMAAAPGADRLAAWLAARFAATLPGLGGSTLPFLQRQFLHCPGAVWLGRDRITLQLEPVALRVVLDLAGRVGDDLGRADWLDGQHIAIQWGRGQS